MKTRNKTLTININAEQHTIGLICDNELSTLSSNDANKHLAKYRISTQELNLINLLLLYLFCNTFQMRPKVSIHTPNYLPEHIFQERVRLMGKNIIGLIINI
jgi:hypothetical protein